jgi:Uma2 family endonuclease
MGFSGMATTERWESTMSTVVVEGDVVHIPARVVDLDSFRRWGESQDFPESGRIGYLNGEVWVDMSKEQLFSHLLVKSQYNMVLGRLAEEKKPGLYFPDGLFLTNLAVDFSWKPDGTFVSMESLQRGLVKLVEGEEGDFVELEGSPDMVLEIVSRSSVHKDTVELRQAYWEAKIREYWLVDARREPLRFDILRHSPKGYVATRKQGGWIKSGVFDKFFKLTQEVSRLGHAQFTLSVR